MTRYLVALGGNALLQPEEEPTYENQYRNALKAMEKIYRAVSEDDHLVITHGNGTQVGVTLLRYYSAGEVPPYPLYAAVAETQALIGHILALAFYNVSEGRERIYPIVTHVVVDPKDPAFKNPSKPIGPAYSFEEAVEYMELGWTFKKTSKGWRRVVPSPEPLEIVEIPLIRTAYEEGHIVVACGGGGIPVAREGERLRPVDAVIDKDRASSLLAISLGVEKFIILTGEEYVYLNYGEPDMEPITETSPEEMREYLKLYSFEEGSIKPKIEAALEYVEKTGGTAIITSLERAGEAIREAHGTVIRP